MAEEKRRGSAGKGEASELRRHQLERFAEQLFNPTSPSFGNVVMSYRAIIPKTDDVSDAAEARRAYRWVNHKVVKRYRSRILMRAADGAPMSKEAFVRLCIDREEYFAKRGERGDNQAAASYMEMLGKAIDVFPRSGKKSAMAQLPPGAPVTGKEVVDMVLAAAERLRRLNEPNPTKSKLDAAEPVEIRTVEQKNAAEAAERRKMCVNHPDKVAYFMTQDSPTPLCKACLERAS